jgi:hypothetical protein
MQCPGQDNRYWSGEAVFEIPCPHCGTMLEFFKDDSQRLCKQCGHRVLNPKIDFGCASYCPYAEQCMGALPAGLRPETADLFKEKLAIAVRRQLLDSEQKYLLVSRRAEFAEQLCREEGGNMATVVAAAMLSESETPLSLLHELKAADDMIREVTRLLARKPAQNDEETTSAAIFHDACLLGELALNMSTNQASPCRTATGRQEAARIREKAGE